MKIPDKAYDVLKWLCILGLPALSSMYSTLAGIWGWPFAEQVPQTLSAVGLFLGTVIGISSANYNQKNTTKKEALENAA